MSEIYQHPEQYDLEHRGDDEDIRFYVSLARTLKPRSILELGSGTGRISGPLAEEGARSGFDVVGLDDQQPMLAAAEKHRADATCDARERLSFVRGDMRAWSRKSSFDLIIIPCSSLSHVLTLEDQLSVFQRCHENLRAGGRFVVEVNMPNMAAYADSFRVPPREPLEIDLDNVDASDGTRLIRRKTTRYLGDQQLAEIRFLYEKYDHRRVVESYIDDFSSHVFFPRELELLFIHTGFAVERTIGDYASRPLRADSPLIIMIGKSRSP